MHLTLPLPSHTVHVAPPEPAPRDRFDPDWARSIVRRSIIPMLEAWFRPELLGAEKIPDHGPVILAANHSGNAFPYDGIALDTLLWERGGLTDAAKFRTVYEYELSLAWWMRPFGIDDFWRRGGGVDMTFDNFDRLLRRGDRVLYFPEGVPGIGKGFNHRYELQPFHTSFVRLAARHDVTVLPVHIVNGEWIHPFGYTFRWLDWLMQRVWLVPFLPLPIGILAIVFPFFWFFAFPARLVFEVGEPIDVRRALGDAGAVEPTEQDEESVRRATQHIRAEMQRGLDVSVAHHQGERYGFRGLLRALRAVRGRRWRATPLGWPVSFLRHERDRARGPARNRLHAILRDIDLAAFYVPFGWPLLTIAHALRRPPYGYRGMSSHERAMIQGRFVWRLSERPLPPRPASN
jgi:1-acyl-sn-glycerol-3-phosphate acyltransferase